MQLLVKTACMFALSPFFQVASASVGVDGNSYLELSEAQRGAYVAGLLNGMEAWATFAMADTAAKFGASTGSTQFLLNARKWLMQCTNDMPLSQVTAIFDKHLKDNPAKLHLKASNLFFNALQDACPPIDG